MDPQPIISVTPDQIDFGNVLIGTSEQDSSSLQIREERVYLLQIFIPTIPSLHLIRHTLRSHPTVSRAVHVTFTPNSINTQIGNLTVYNNSSVSQVGLNVTGTGTRPILHFSRTSIPFLSVQLGMSKQDSFYFQYGHCGINRFISYR